MARANTDTPPADEPNTGSDPATAQGERPSAEEYKTQGKTVVATRVGHAFNDSSGKVPTITPEGVTVTSEEATRLVEESKGRVHIVTEKED